MTESNVIPQNKIFATTCYGEAERCFESMKYSNKSKC